MRRKGYKNYRGSRNNGKILAYIVLSMIIIASVVYLIVQNYVVYDKDGRRQVALPEKFAKSTTEKTEKEEKVEEEVIVEYKDPEIDTHMLRRLEAQFVSAYDIEQLSAEEILSLSDSTLMLEVKNLNGALTYQPSFDVPSAIKVQNKTNRELIETVLQSEDHYKIAYMCCLCDSYYVRTEFENSLRLQSGSYFYDGNGGYAWLDPTSTAVQSYIVDLCKDYATLGFNEIVLDFFSYPTTGRLDAINIDASVDRVAVITDLAEQIRSSLPDGTRLSIVIRSEISPEFGLSNEMISQCFDRVYVPEGVDISSLIQALPRTFNQTTQIVHMVNTPETASSYVLMTH